MKLQKLIIKNFRGLKGDKNIIDFSDSNIIFLIGQNNVGKSSYGGAITAALFLEEFIEPNCPWAHIDLMAWNLNSTPGRPEGGEAMGLLSVFNYLCAVTN